MPATLVTNYKTLKVENIEFTVPEKIKGKYVSYLVNDKAPIYVQTPTMVVDHIKGNSIVFRIKADSPFAKLLTEFDDHCADYFSQHSEKFFNGKIFSKAKISNAYSPLHKPLKESPPNSPSEQHAEPDYIRLTLELNNNVLVKDQRDVTRTLDDVEPGTEAIAVIDMENICIGKNNIQPVFTLQQMKIYVKERLTNWCIQHDEDSDEEEEPIVDEKDVEEQIKALEQAATIKTEPSAKAERKKRKTAEKALENQDSLVENKANDSVDPIDPVDRVNDDDKDFF